MLNKKLLKRIDYLEKVIDIYGNQLRELEKANRHLIEQLANAENNLRTSLTKLETKLETKLDNLNDIGTSTDKSTQDGFDYENYKEQVQANYAPFANSINIYQRLISHLSKNNKIQVEPMSLLMNEIIDNKKLISLRHDVDADPEMGIYMARALAKVGISGTFYLLHSALYYGQQIDQHFVRNPLLKKWVVEYIVSGCELGLHCDALGMSTIDTKRCGINMFYQELAYIRAQGATITGMSAHNTFPINHAENFEVFEEYMLFDRTKSELDNIPCSLGSESAVEHGLVYEANYPLKKKNIDHKKLNEFLSITPDMRDKSWMKIYLHDNPYMNRDYDCDIWLVGKNQWVASMRKNGYEQYCEELTFSEVLEFIDLLPEQSRSVITLHPEYFQFT